MEIIKEFGKIAGIAGIGLGVFLIVFKDIIAKNIFPKMTSEQGYKTIRLLILLVWSIAVGGIGVWTFFEYLKTINKPESTHSVPVPKNNRTDSLPEQEIKKTNNQNDQTKPTNSNASNKKQPEFTISTNKIYNESFCRIITNSKYSQAKILVDNKQSVLVDKYGSTKMIRLAYKPDKTYLITLVLGIDTIYSEKHFMKFDTTEVIISRI